jgi:Ca2+-binding RTX toxin-like protein
MDANGSNQVNITNSPGTDDRLPDWGVPATGGGGVQQGTDEDDDLTGTSEPDTVFAGDGDDVVNSGGGADVVFGEGGNDKINGGAANDKLYGDFAPSSAARPSRFGLALQEEEEPLPGNDVLNGGGGADLAVGGAGDDTLNGGPGVDRMKGGPGEDTCVFSSRNELAQSSGCEHKKRNFKRNFRP